VEDGESLARVAMFSSIASYDTFPNTGRTSAMSHS
jgi:hypothetical protein